MIWLLYRDTSPVWTLIGNGTRRISAIFQLVRFWPGIQALRPQQTMQTSCSVSPEGYALRCYPCCIHQPELSLKPSSLQLVDMAEEIEWFRSLAAAQK